MKSVHLRTLLLLLLAALLLLTAPAVADSSSQNTVVTYTVCEVAVVKDSSAQSIAFTIDGESGKTSAFVAKGGSVTISVSSIPSGKNLIVSHTGQAVLTKSGMTITVSNVQSDLVTITMKLESAGTGGGGGSGSGGGGVTPPKVYTAFVEENGAADFPTHKVIYRVTVPEEHEGKRIDIIDQASVKAGADMDVYHQADIKHHFDLAEGDKAVVHFRIPASALKAKGLEAEDACLYHYSDETGWTKLPTVYTVSGDTVYYESEAAADGSFAVVFEKGSAKPKDSGGEEPVIPQQPEDVPCEPCYPCIVVLLLVLLAGIGAAVILRRKKKNKK